MKTVKILAAVVLLALAGAAYAAPSVTQDAAKTQEQSKASKSCCKKHGAAQTSTGDTTKGDSCCAVGSCRCCASGSCPSHQRAATAQPAVQACAHCCEKGAACCNDCGEDCCKAHTAGHAPVEAARHGTKSETAACCAGSCACCGGDAGDKGKPGGR